MNGLGARVKALRQDRGLLQKHVADKAGLTVSMVSQIESGRLNPTLSTLGKLADAFGISIPELLEPPAGGRTIHISRKQEHPLVSFEDCAERWMVLGAGLFEGKIRAVVSTLDGRARGVSTDTVRIKAAQMKLFYVLQGKVALRHADKLPNERRGQRARGWRRSARLGQHRPPPRACPLGDSRLTLGGSLGSEVRRRSYFRGDDRRRTGEAVECSPKVLLISELCMSRSVAEAPLAWAGCYPVIESRSRFRQRHQRLARRLLPLERTRLKRAAS